MHQALTSDSTRCTSPSASTCGTWLDAGARSRSTLRGRPRVPARGRPEPRLPAAARPARRRAARRARASGSCARAGRSSTASSPSCGRSTVLDRRDAVRAPATTVIADLDGATLSFEGRDCASRSTSRRARVPGRRRRRRSRAADLPGSLDDAGRLVLVRRLVREGFLRRAVARVPLRPAEPLGRAREVRRLAFLAPHLDGLVRPRRRARPRPAVVVRATGRDHARRRRPRRARSASRTARSAACAGNGVARAATVLRQVDLAAQRRLERPATTSPGSTRPK